MKVDYTKQFVQDLERYPDMKSKVLAILEDVSKAISHRQIKNIKKLNSAGNDFRIKTGHYRLGCSMDGNTMILKDSYTEKIFTGFSPDIKTQIIH